MDINACYLFVLWIFCVLSTFIIPPIYIVIFPFFALNVFVLLILSNFRFKKHNFKLLCGLLIFISIPVVSSIINARTVNSLLYTKIIVNSLFLFSSTYLASKKADFLYRNKKAFFYVLALVAFLSFIQVIYRVEQLNLWTKPFVGMTNSMEANSITNSGIYFGNESKNIWASKIAFIQIILLGLLLLNVIKTNKIVTLFWITICLINMLYTFSRTAQGFFILFIAISIVYLISRIKSRSLRVLMIIGSLLAGSVTLPIIAKKSFRVDNINLNGKQGEDPDGMTSRIVLWNLFSTQVKNVSPVVGEGLGTPQEVIKLSGNHESNFHNTFMNMYYEMGTLGIFLFIFILFWIFKLSKHEFSIPIVLFLLPLIVCLFNQYQGYDNDIMLYLSNVFIVFVLLKQKMINVGKNANMIIANV